VQLAAVRNHTCKQKAVLRMIANPTIRVLNFCNLEINWKLNGF